MATYPDVTVVCGVVETAPGDPHAVTNLTVIVEVLSDHRMLSFRAFRARRRTRRALVRLLPEPIRRRLRRLVGREVRSGLAR